MFHKNRLTHSEKHGAVKCWNGEFHNNWELWCLWTPANLITSWREFLIAFQDKANTTDLKPMSPASHAKYEANSTATKFKEVWKNVHQRV